MMDLTTALKRVDSIRSVIDLMARAETAGWRPLDTEALSVVLTAARENYASRVVAETHAIVERAREMERPHPFIPAIMLGLVIGNCRICGAMESAPIHQQAKETA